MATRDRSPDNDIPSDDELDAIINGTHNGIDIFDTSNLDAETQAQPSLLSGNKKLSGDDVLGLEEEVTVQKQKRPNPKLDEELLLSDLGIPKLQKISKDRLKLKGKGHEYSDIARLLNMYQLWLDGLFPRAKFADGLVMIEKLGHTKKMRMMRQMWIDEGKPKAKSDQEDEGSDTAMMDQPPQESIEVGDTTDAGTHSKERSEAAEQTQPTVDTVGADMEPEEDELDALLAEDGVSMMHGRTEPASKTVADEDDQFADDLEAMAEMEGMW